MLNPNYPAPEHYFSNGNSKEDSREKRFDKKLEYFSGLLERRRFKKAREIADVILREGCSRPLICYAASYVMSRYLRENMNLAVEMARNFYSFPYYFECWLPKQKRELIAIE